MAKKPLAPLNFIDIVTRADADLIREALTAREKIDDLLVIREEAYRKIAEVENSIEDLVGQEKVFQFDPPPYAVAGMKGAQPYKPKPASSTDAPSAKKDESAVDELATPSDGDSLEEKKEILAESEQGLESSILDADETSMLPATTDETPVIPAEEEPRPEDV